MLGERGLSGCGLSDVQRELVQRFDPSTRDGATSIGFFVARSFSQRVAKRVHRQSQFERTSFEASLVACAVLPFVALVGWLVAFHRSLV